MMSRAGPLKKFSVLLLKSSNQQQICERQR